MKIPHPATEIPQSDDSRYAAEAPQVIGDFGQDDAFSTESHPEGLRYGERRRPPGVEFYGSLGIPADQPEKGPTISVGPDAA